MLLLRDVHGTDFIREVNQETPLSLRSHIKTSPDSSVPKQQPNKNQILKVKWLLHADTVEPMNPAVESPQVWQADLFNLAELRKKANQTDSSLSYARENYAVAEVMKMTDVALINLATMITKYRTSFA